MVDGLALRRLVVCLYYVLVMQVVLAQLDKLPPSSLISSLLSNGVFLHDDMTALHLLRLIGVVTLGSLLLGGVRIHVVLSLSH